MKIKVCGLKDPGNINDVNALSPDYVGFICYDLSPRFISGLQPELLPALPETLIKTGVFVNEAKETINALIDRYGFNAVQLHGNESPEFCEEFKGRVKVLKAFGVDEDFNFELLNAYANSVDYFLFDTKTPKHGGSGTAFNWSILQKYTLDVPFFLSGGLSLDNLPEVEKIKHPQFYGVDLNSRFETEPGIKDIELLKQAFNILRQSLYNEIRS
jgi:phosphoribosylanthranilate isomerase